MQVRTFGTWASFFTSVGAGALTQTPDYQFLALPVALVTGALFLILSGMFLYSNRREILRITKLIEPAHVIILGLVIALGGVVWQLRSSPPPDPRVAELQAQVATLQSTQNSQPINPAYGGIDPIRLKKEDAKAPVSLSEPTLNPLAKNVAGPPIEWRFDAPVSILFTYRSPGTPMLIQAIQIHATNKTDKPLKNVRAVITPDMTDKKLEMRVNPHGYILNPEDSATMIPPRASFDLMVTLPSKGDKLPQGLQAQEFLSAFGGLKFEFAYDEGHTFSEYFPLRYLEDQIDRVEKQTRQPLAATVPAIKYGVTRSVNQPLASNAAQKATPSKETEPSSSWVKDPKLISGGFGASESPLQLTGTYSRGGKMLKFVIDLSVDSQTRGEHLRTVPRMKIGDAHDFVRGQAFQITVTSYFNNERTVPMWGPRRALSGIDDETFGFTFFVKATIFAIDEEDKEERILSFTLLPKVTGADIANEMTLSNPSGVPKIGTNLDWKNLIVYPEGALSALER